MACIAFKRLIAPAFLTLLVVACGSDPATVAPSDPAQTNQTAIQTILKFKDQGVRVDAGLLARMGVSVGARIDYVRAMSGGAHVVRITPQATENYARVLTRLRADPAIDYVEQDALMSIQR